MTDEATQVIEEILSTPGIPEGAGMRVTAGASSSDTGPPARNALQLAVVETPADTDTVIDERGARAFVDEAVADYLGDKLLDANVDGEQVQFAIAEQP